MASWSTHTTSSTTSTKEWGKPDESFFSRRHKGSKKDGRLGSLGPWDNRWFSIRSVGRAWPPFTHARCSWQRGRKAQQSRCMAPLLGSKEGFHSPLFVPTSQGERQRRRHRGASESEARLKCYPSLVSLAITKKCTQTRSSTPKRHRQAWAQPQPQPQPRCSNGKLQ